jgi:hypothetical protein
MTIHRLARIFTLAAFSFSSSILIAEEALFSSWITIPHGRSAISYDLGYMASADELRLGITDSAQCQSVPAVDIWVRKSRSDAWRRASFRRGGYYSLPMSEFRYVDYQITQTAYNFEVCQFNLYAVGGGSGSGNWSEKLEDIAWDTDMAVAWSVHLQTRMLLVGAPYDVLFEDAERLEQALRNFETKLEERGLTFAEARGEFRWVLDDFRAFRSKFEPIQREGRDREVQRNWDDLRERMTRIREAFNLL